MTRNKAFLVAQSLLCALVAALLAAGALSLYLEGSAGPAKGDLFNYMFTREKVGARLLPILPLCCGAFGLSLAGWILGIRDEKADNPVRDPGLLRDLGSIRKDAVRQQADQGTLILRAAVLAAALFLIILGILNGGLEDVLARGAAICSECIGLG